MSVVLVQSTTSSNTLHGVQPEVRAVARTLIGGGGVDIHVFMFCPTNFFSNQIQISQLSRSFQCI